MGASDQNTRYYQRKPVFRHLPVSESDSWENQMPRAESFLKEEEKPFGVETEAISWNDEEEEPWEEPEPLFYITATRYEKGKPVQAKVTRIPIGPEGLVLGRIAFTTDSRFFFSSGSGEIDRHYACISRYNVELHIDQDRLYVGYCQDTGQKSAVYVNQERLKKDEVRELSGGDVLRFGGRNASDQTIDVRILAAGEDNLPVKPAAAASDPVQWDILQDFMEEIRQKTSETYRGVVLANESLTQIQGDIQRINGAVAAISPDDLRIRADEGRSDYEDRLSARVPEVAPVTREEYISRFLKSVLEEGSEGYRKKLEFFNARERRGHLLYQAAFYENACEAIGLGDYAGPMSFLGKAVEGFVMGEIARVAETFNHDAYARLHRDKSGRLNQNDILGLCRNNGAKARILRAAGFGRDVGFARRMDEALNVLHMVRIARNDASHCDPDTEEPVDGVVEEITRERYQEIKERLFTSDTLETMHALYLRTPQTAGR